MTENKFNLSEKIRTDRAYNEVDVKEFIKQIKKWSYTADTGEGFFLHIKLETFNKLAGDKLI
jgi:protein associated with RNAse G/E